MSFLDNSSMHALFNTGVPAADQPAEKPATAAAGGEDDDPIHLMKRHKKLKKVGSSQTHADCF